MPSVSKVGQVLDTNIPVLKEIRAGTVPILDGLGIIASLAILCVRIRAHRDEETYSTHNPARGCCVHSALGLLVKGVDIVLRERDASLEFSNASS